MKIRQDLVTNSSSSVFILVNISNKDKTLLDFITEQSLSIQDVTKAYNEQYQDYYNDEDDEDNEMPEYKMKEKLSTIIKSKQILIEFDDWIFNMIINLIKNKSSETFIWSETCF